MGSFIRGNLLRSRDVQYKKGFKKKSCYFVLVAETHIDYNFMFKKHYSARRLVSVGMKITAQRLNKLL